jgi:hypothetical protein
VDPHHDHYSEWVSIRHNQDAIRHHSNALRKAQGRTGTDEGGTLKKIRVHSGATREHAALARGRVDARHDPETSMYGTRHGQGTIGLYGNVAKGAQDGTGTNG